MMRCRALLALLIACLTPFGAMAQEARRAVVFDIDGTLTPSVYAIAIPRTGAAEAARTFAAAGIEVIYVSARVPLFQGSVAGWLAEHEFPDGPIHLTQTEVDQADHGAFKERVLSEYLTEGWSIVAAFGDSSSDFAAYAASGVPPSRVFALRRFGRSDCKVGDWHGCYDDWHDLMPVVEAIAQP